MILILILNICSGTAFNYITNETKSPLPLKFLPKYTGITTLDPTHYESELSHIQQLQCFLNIAPHKVCWIYKFYTKCRGFTN